LIGAAVGAGFIYGTAAIYLRLRGVEGMGMGDVKLMAMVGAFLGAPLTLFVLATASFLGGLYGAMVVLNIFRKRLSRYRRGPKQSSPVARAWQSASLSLRFYEMPFGVLLGSMALFASVCRSTHSDSGISGAFSPVCTFLTWMWSRFTRAYGRARIVVGRFGPITAQPRNQSPADESSLSAADFILLAGDTATRRRYIFLATATSIRRRIRLEPKQTSAVHQIIHQSSTKDRNRR
jgi:hypothetical protein